MTLALGGVTNFEIPPNGQGVGFFLIGNGFTFNNGYAGVDLSAGNLAFYYHYGQADQRLAKVTDNGFDITLVALEPSPVVISGPVYHTTDRDGSTAINPDGMFHTISGLADPNDPTVLRIGFEDLPAQGDRDFSDVVFDFTYTPAPPQETFDQFCYVVTDCDGDSSMAALNLTGTLGAIPISQPVVVNVDVSTNVIVTNEVTITNTLTMASISEETDTTFVKAPPMTTEPVGVPLDDGGFTVYYDPVTGQAVCGPTIPVAPPDYPYPDTKEPIVSNWPQPYEENDVLVMLNDIMPIKIADFDAGEGDMLDFSALVQDFDPVSDAINDFVYARSEGQDTVISVDPTGQGAPSQAIDVVILKDVSINHVEDVVQIAQQQQNQSGTGAL